MYIVQECMYNTKLGILKATVLEKKTVQHKKNIYRQNEDIWRLNGLFWIWVIN